MDAQLERPVWQFLPGLVTVLICSLLWMHGPIAQFADYHNFADQSAYLGIPHTGDVLSNLGFAMLAVWGMARLWPVRNRPDLQETRYGYGLLLIGLLLTAIGSSFYHLAPDNARLVWDRLPISLACAGLLAAVRAECIPHAYGKASTILLGMFAIIGVAWWRISDLHGAGDLRLYLLLQILPLTLIPIWQAVYHAPRADRLACGIALLVYVAAKFAEVYDHQILMLLSVISGHTIKHLLATAAAGILVLRIVTKNHY
jgi:hypothetical protein